jgi:hypothetical protein
MLIEYTEAKSRSIGNLYLMPGINQVDDKRWDYLTKESNFRNPIKGMINQGLLVVTDDREKITIAMVEKTYDTELLSEWLANPKNKGPLRGAIRKQLQVLEVEEAI